MTGATGSAAYAFVGFGISRLFSNPGALSDIYGYGWYVHAALTGVFIALLPFSRLLHIILSPVVLALNAVTRHDQASVIAICTCCAVLHQLEDPERFYRSG